MGTRARHAILVFVALFAATTVGAREIELSSSRVTSADVAVSPDGASVVFSMLGHLFRVPVAGGTAEQLTFGPTYDKEPVYSPDGATLAFVSDRDSDESNIFVLSLRSGTLTQLTHETWADIPAFSPDGRAIFYGRHVPATRGTFPTRDAERVICRVALAGGPVETIPAPPRHLGSIFFLPDGRLAWTSADLDGASSEYVTHIEALSASGSYRHPPQRERPRRLGDRADPRRDGLRASRDGKCLRRVDPSRHRGRDRCAAQWRRIKSGGAGERPGSVRNLCRRQEPLPGRPRPPL